MIVYATKLTIRKAAIGLAVLGGIIWGIAALAPHAVQSVSAQNGSSISQKLKDNAARVQYLQGFGWLVTETPTVQMEVQIPQEFDAAYQTYNAVQLRQGLDLTRYRGKRAMLYTYTVTNYPNQTEGVTASLLLYKDRVVAADITSASGDGFTLALTEHPSTAQASQTPSAQGSTASPSTPQKTPQTSPPAAAEATPAE